MLEEVRVKLELVGPYILQRVDESSLSLSINEEKFV